MATRTHARWIVLLATGMGLLLAACSRKAEGPDHPRLTPGVTLQDIVFHSTSLNREMPYRVILPTSISAGQRLPVVYLLHGGGGSFRDWSNNSDVARFAERGLILVMPEGDESYYTNSAVHPNERYEDYIVNDVISDVEKRFPAIPGRSGRVMVGVSMGGFGAIKLALKRPELFTFAGAISPAIDVPSRPFSIKRYWQWRHHRSIFGPWHGEAQQKNDPYVLAGAADPAKVPFLFITCGDKEGLLPANRRFAALLEKNHYAFEFHVVHGGHDWNQWNQQLRECFARLLAHLNQEA